MPEKINQKLRQINYKNRQKRSLVYMAIPVPQDVQNRIVEKINKLSSNKHLINWIDADQAQIMLLTFGEISPERANDAITSLLKVANVTKAFSLKASGLGYFAKERSGGDPSISGRNRWIIYLDIPDPKKELRGFYKELFNDLVNEDFFPPLNLNPRIRLGALIDKSGSREQRESVLENLISEDFELEEFTIDSVNVYSITGRGQKIIKTVQLLG